MDFDLFYAHQVPLVIAVANAYQQDTLGDSYISETALLSIFCALSVGLYFHMALSVISEISNHLQINCLTIPHDNPAARKKNGEAEEPVEEPVEKENTEVTTEEEKTEETTE